MRQLNPQTEVRLWLLVVGTATILIGTTYVVAQQSTRLGANDAPLAAAQEARAQLAANSPLAQIVPGPAVDLATDSTVFVILTDRSRTVAASSARLDGQTPLPPAGVFADAAIHGSDHFTWQPQNGVRLATEVLSYKSWYIIAGQSLSQPERRIEIYGALSLFGWLAAVIWSTLLIYWTKLPGAKPKK